MTTRHVLVGLAACVLLPILAAVLWVDVVGHSNMSQCRDVEGKDYPRLEATAREVLGTVGDRYQRVSFCEDAGEPGAVVTVSVYDWNTRKEARAYLRGTGLVSGLGLTMLSVDGLQVTYPTARDSQVNEGRRFVMVQFGTPR